MFMILLYYVLLALPLPLLWLAWRTTGWVRYTLLLIALVGLAALLHEVRMWLGRPSEIRLDIPLIAIALGILYFGAALVLYLARKPRSATALAAVILAIGGAMAYEWHLAGLEAARLRQHIEARNALLFEARFRDQQTYERVFGPFAPVSGPIPAGHWLGPEDAYWSRLIVNAEGRLWLFYRCGDTECSYGATGATLERTGEAEASWQTVAAPPDGVPIDIRLTQDGTEHLSLAYRGRLIPFRRAPPPIAPSPAPESLHFLGSYAATACRGQHAVVRQLWLWREAARLYAVAVAATLIAGRHAGFVSPLVLGAGQKQGDNWHFAIPDDGRFSRATVALSEGGAVLTLSAGNQAGERTALAPGAVFQDEVVDLAPLTGGTEWQAWFDVVFTGQFLAADIPAC